MTLFSLNSCSNDQANGTEEIAASGFGVTNVMKSVPSNALMVGVLDLGNLMKKGDYESFKKSEMFQSILDQDKVKENEELRSILEDPKKSGIATNGQICMFVEMESQKEGRACFLLPVRKLKDLEAIFNKSAAENEDSPFKNIQEGKGYKYVTDKEGDSDVVMAWNKKMLVFSAGTKNPVSAMDPIFKANRKESILSNKKFKAEKSEGHDMMVWVNSTPFAKIMLEDKKIAKNISTGLFAAGLTKDALEDNAMALFYDFNKGKMTTGLSYDMNETLAKEYGILFKNKVKTNFSKYFPVENMSNIVMMGLSTKGINSILEKRNLKGMADGQLAAMGMTTDEILNGLNGDIAFATYINPNNLEEQEVVAAITFNDTKLIDKLVEISAKTGTGMTKEGNRLTIKDKAFANGGGIIDGKVLIMASNAAVLDQIEKGGYKGAAALEKKHFAAMSKGWMGSHVDYDRLIKTVSNSPLTRMGGLGSMFKTLAKYDALASMTTVFSTEEATATMQLKNTKDNSLKVVLQLMDEIYKENKEYIKEAEPVSSEETTM